MPVAAATRAWIGLGSNLDDPRYQLEAALRALAALPDCAGLRVSSLYRSPPWGLSAQPAYLNAVAVVETVRSPLELLEALLAIERQLGRRRGDGPRWGPRRIDLDLLLHGQARIDLPGLRLPHPRLHQRAFVLLPMAELEPDLELPGLGPLQALLAALPASERAAVEKLTDAQR